MFKRHSILILPLLIFGMFFAFSNKAEALTYTCKHDSGTGIGCGDDWYCTNAPGTGSAKCLTASAIFNRCTGLTPATIDIPNCAGTDTCGICSSCTNLATGNGTLCGTYPSTSCVPAYSGSSPIANCSVYTADCSTTNTCSTCVSSSYENCDGGTRCQLKRTVSDAPVIPNCTAFNQCAAGQPCSSCASQYALCSATNSCVSNPSGDLCASLVNCTTGQCASCVSGASRCAATNTCVADKTCPSGQTFDPCATGSNYCTGTANSLKIGYDSLRPDNFLFNSTLSLPSLTIPPSGYVGLGTTTPSSILSVSGGNIFVNDSVITSLTPKAAITKDYLDSALSAYSSSNSMWQLSGNNLFASSTAWNVGIGTTNPSYKLDVNGTMHVTAGNLYGLVLGDPSVANSRPRILQNSPAGIASFNTFQDNSVSKFSWGYGGSGTSPVNSFFISRTADFTSPDFLLTPTGSFGIGLNGNVGIGTTTPSAIFDVLGKTKITSAGTIYNTDSTRYLDMTGILTDSLKISGDIYSTAGELKTDGTGINYMLGSLGIGTTTPVNKLDVIGVINATAGFRVNNTAGAAGSYLRSNGTNFVVSTIQASDVPTLNQNTTGYSNTLNYEDNRTISPSELAANRMKFGFTSYSNNNTSPWADFLHLRSYQDASGGNDNLLVFNKASLGMRLYQQTWASTTAYTTYKDVLLSDNSPAVNYITKYTNNGTSVSVGKSIIYDNGTSVAIGTTIPDAKLQVAGSFHVSGALNSVVLDRLTGTGNRIVMADASGSLYATSSSIATGLPVGTAGQTLRSDGTNWLANSVIYNNGTNVGIGTTTPNIKLLVKDSSATYVARFEGAASSVITIGNSSLAGQSNTQYVNSLGQTWVGINNAGLAELSSTGGATGLAFSTAGNERMRINNSGNVGIGTTTPSAIFDVLGKTKITSAGTIYNTDSTRYLDMTGVLTDSLKISGDIYSTAGELKTDGTGVNYMLGNLGIGTNSASVKLQISGGANQVINVGGGRIGGLAAPQSADEAVPLSYLTANYLATSSDSGVTSISLTATTYNGSLTYTGGYTGYDAGNKICNAYVTGSHFCRTDEILYLVQKNGAAGFTAINGDNSWIADGPPGFTGAVSADDCGGWTDGTNTKLGHFWMFNSTGGGRGSLSSCDTMKKVACCK